MELVYEEIVAAILHEGFFLSIEIDLKILD
jgi:hypothetical protein